MDRSRSWIDIERLRALVEQTAWQPSEPEEPESSWRAEGRAPQQPSRFVAAEDEVQERLPPSRRRTEAMPDAPNRAFGPPPGPQVGDAYEPERTEPRIGPPVRTGRIDLASERVEPPPAPTPEFRVASGPGRPDMPTLPRIERRTPKENRSVEPPPEPVVVPRAVLPAVPPPPAFSQRAPYEPAKSASLEDKLAHLLDWATDVSGFEVAFVADHEGLLLARRRASDVEEAVAAVLEGFLAQLGPFLGDAVEGHVTLRSHGRVFVVTWHETEAGRFFLGIVGSSAPPPSVVPDLAAALAATVASAVDLSSDEEALDEGPADGGSSDEVRSAPRAEPEASETVEPDPPRGGVLDRLEASAIDSHAALLRVSLQTGVAIAKLREPGALSDAEIAAVERSVERIVGRAF